MECLFGFMCHITTKVPPYDAVPGGVVLLVKLLLDMGSNVLPYSIFLQFLSTPHSPESCCISSDVLAFFITAFRSHVVTKEHGLADCSGPLGEGLARLRPDDRSGPYGSRGALMEPLVSRRRLAMGPTVNCPDCMPGRAWGTSPQK